MTIRRTIRHLLCLTALVAPLLAVAPATAATDREVLSEITRLVNNRGVFRKSGLAPQVRITSPLAGAFIAPGDSRVGAGNPNGTGFAIVAEIVTRANNHVTVDEDVNIRNVKVNVDRSVTGAFGSSGNGLTLNPGESLRVAGGTAPIVEIVAPREPSAVTFGQAPPNGSLHYIQVNIIDKEGDVVVDELGAADGLLDPANPNEGRENRAMTG